MPASGLSSTKARPSFGDFSLNEPQSGAAATPISRIPTSAFAATGMNFAAPGWGPGGPRVGCSNDGGVGGAQRSRADPKRGGAIGIERSPGSVGCLGGKTNRPISQRSVDRYRRRLSADLGEKTDRPISETECRFGQPAEALGHVGRDLDFPLVGSVRPLRLPGSLDCLREIGRRVRMRQSPSEASSEPLIPKRGPPQIHICSHLWWTSCDREPKWVQSLDDWLTLSTKWPTRSMTPPG